MSRARRLLVVACAPVAVFIAGMWITRQVQTHPFLFHAPADASHAFSWDTTAEIGRRGSCGPGADERDTASSAGELRADWRPQLGRYVLTMLIRDGQRHWRPVRGRLWLHDASKTASAPTAPDERASGPAAEYLLHGATDLDLTRVFSTGTLSAALTPPPASTDSSAPGVVVVRNPQSNSLVMIIGRGAPVIVFRLTGGVGDGFWGRWHGGDSTVHDNGFFCAGWIDV